MAHSVLYHSVPVPHSAIVHSTVEACASPGSPPDQRFIEFRRGRLGALPQDEGYDATPGAHVRLQLPWRQGRLLSVRGGFDILCQSARAKATLAEPGVLSTFFSLDQASRDAARRSSAASTRPVRRSYAEKHPPKFAPPGT